MDNNEALEEIYLAKEIEKIIKEQGDKRYKLYEVLIKKYEKHWDYETLREKFEELSSLENALTPEEREEYLVKYIYIVDKMVTKYASKGKEVCAMLDEAEIYSCCQLALYNALFRYRKGGENDNIVGYIVTVCDRAIVDLYRRYNKEAGNLSVDYIYTNGTENGEADSNLDTSKSMEDFLAREVDYEQLIAVEELADLILLAMRECLNPREQYVLISTFALGERAFGEGTVVVPKTQQVIALELNTTQTTVHNLLESGKKRLGKHLKKFYWEELQELLGYEL